jgi:LEA14-like dessication related protein
MIERMRQWWMVAPVVVLMASCSTMPKDFETPRVNIADLTPKDMAIFEQRFDVKLRIQNPNNVELSINGLLFDI